VCGGVFAGVDTVFLFLRSFASNGTPYQRTASQYSQTFTPFMTSWASPAPWPTAPSPAPHTHFSRTTSCILYAPAPFDVRRLAAAAPSNDPPNSTPGLGRYWHSRIPRHEGCPSSSSRDGGVWTLWDAAFYWGVETLTRTMIFSHVHRLPPYSHPCLSTSFATHSAMLE